MKVAQENNQKELNIYTTVKMRIRRMSHLDGAIKLELGPII